MKLVTILEEDFIELKSGELLPLSFFSTPNIDNLYSNYSCDDNLYHQILEMDSDELLPHIFFYVGGMNYKNYQYCDHISLSKKDDNTIFFLFWLSYDISSWNEDINFIIFREEFLEACEGEKFIFKNEELFDYEDLFSYEYNERLYSVVLVEKIFESGNTIDILVSDILFNFDKKHNEIINKNKEFKKIIRESIIPKEYQSSAISLLHYFGNIIDHLYPDIDISLSVENLQDKVKIIINCPVSDESKIIELFETYGLVISGKKEKEDLLSNSHEIMMLEHKLDMAKMELVHSNQRIEFERKGYDSRIKHLEKSSEYYSSLLSEMISQNKIVREDFKNIANDINYSNDDKIKSLLGLLSENMEVRNEENVSELLSEIKEKSPSLFEHINDIFIKGSLSGVTGNILYQWVMPIISSIPK